MFKYPLRNCGLFCREKDEAVVSLRTRRSKFKLKALTFTYVAPGGGGVLPEKLGGGVQPASQNPYPIYDQNLRYSTPYL